MAMNDFSNSEAQRVFLERAKRKLHEAYRTCEDARRYEESIKNRRSLDRHFENLAKHEKRH